MIYIFFSKKAHFILYFYNKSEAPIPSIFLFLSHIFNLGGIVPATPNEVPSTIYKYGKH